MELFCASRNNGQTTAMATTSTREATNSDANGSTIFSVEWRPFQIDPGTKASGETVSEYCRQRWGGDGWTHQLKQEGRKDNAKFDDWQWWPSTLKAHQLVRYCSTTTRRQGRGANDDENTDSNNDNNLQPYCSSDHINALLFDAEYERGENISIVDVLVRIGQAAGVPDDKLDDLRRYLANDEGKADVQREIAQGRRKYGILGVPYFIVSNAESAAMASSSCQQRPYGFSGAQSAETFVELFEKLSEQY